MGYSRVSILAIVWLSGSAWAQVPSDKWEYEAPYRDEMLYLHSLTNYSHDLRWQYDWERRQLARNALRVKTGSVTSKELLTDIDINLNQPLNDKWRFVGSFTRTGLRQWPQNEERLLLGFERSIFRSSAVYLTMNPRYDKEFIDVAAGYTLYHDDREQYVRVGVLVEDWDYQTKTDTRGISEQDPIALQWLVRLALPNEWYLYSEGEVSSGFEHVYPDEVLSPDVSRHNQQRSTSQLRVSRSTDDGTAWSAWVEWYEFNELKQFRKPGFDYDYRNTQLVVALEHARVFRDRHRIRLLAHYVDQQAESAGFNEHTYDRSDILGGGFYEYLWPNSSATFGYGFGRPDIAYRTPDPAENYDIAEYRDKIMVGWRYSFSDDAQVYVSVAHEVSAQGFGGGAVRFQMFF